jgi:hypothetical protein
MAARADIEAYGVERWLAELALALRQETYRTLIQLAQISQPLLEPTQLGVIKRPGRLLPIAGSKGHGRSAIK